MAKARGGTTVTARLIGVNDDAGNVVTLTQGQGQSLEDFGKKLAEALEPAVKSLARRQGLRRPADHQAGQG